MSSGRISVEGRSVNYKVTTSDKKPISLNADQQAAVFAIVQTVQKGSEQLKKNLLEREQHFEIADETVYLKEGDTKVNLLSEDSTVLNQSAKSDVLQLVQTKLSGTPFIKQDGVSGTIEITVEPDSEFKKVQARYKAHLEFHNKLDNAIKNLKNPAWLSPDIDKKDLSVAYEKLFDESTKLLTIFQNQVENYSNSPQRAQETSASELKRAFPNYMKALRQASKTFKTLGPLIAQKQLLVSQNDLQSLSLGGATFIKTAVGIGSEIEHELTIQSRKLEGAQELYSILMSNPQKFYQYCSERGISETTMKHFMRAYNQAISAVSDFGTHFNEVSSQIHASLDEGKLDEALALYSTLLNTHFQKLANGVDPLNECMEMLDRIQGKGATGQPGFLNQVVNEYYQSQTNNNASINLRDKFKELAEIPINMINTQDGILKAHSEYQVAPPSVKTTLSSMQKVVKEINDKKPLPDSAEKRTQENLQSTQGKFIQALRNPSLVFQDESKEYEEDGNIMYEPNDISDKDINRSDFGRILKNNGLRAQDFEALGEITDALGEIVAPLHVDYTIIFSGQNERVSEMKSELSAILDQKRPQINKQLKKFDRWGGRNKLESLRRALASYASDLLEKKAGDKLSHEESKYVDKAISSLEQSLGYVDGLIAKIDFTKNLFQSYQKSITWVDGIIANTFLGRQNMHILNNEARTLPLKFTKTDYTVFSSLTDDYMSIYRELYNARRDSLENPSDSRLRKNYIGLVQRKAPELKDLQHQIFKWAELPEPKEKIQGQTIDTKVQKLSWSLFFYKEELQLRLDSPETPEHDKPLLRAKLAELSAFPDVGQILYDALHDVDNMISFTQKPVSSTKEQMKPRSNDSAFSQKVKEEGNKILGECGFNDLTDHQIELLDNVIPNLQSRMDALREAQAKVQVDPSPENQAALSKVIEDQKVEAQQMSRRLKDDGLEVKEEGLLASVFSGLSKLGVFILDLISSPPDNVLLSDEDKTEWTAAAVSLSDYKESSWWEKILKYFSFYEA